MKRREFIAGLGVAAVWPVAAPAQQPIVIGLLGTREEESLAFHRGLADMGYVEGRNIAIEYRWADQYDRLPALAADLVRRQVAAIATLGGTAVALALKAETKTIPIVFGVGTDPVRDGLVASLNRPGGNLTGIAALHVDVVAKRLELLRELLPAAKTIAFLGNPANRLLFESETEEFRIGAQTLGLNISILKATNSTEIDDAFRMLGERRSEGLVISGESIFRIRREQVIALAARLAVPTIYQWREDAQAGGLMSYGTSWDEGSRIMGQYVGRILQGEKPADLPVQQVTKIQLTINTKAAKAFGLTFPPALVGRADEVIE
jgi:putative tryptophan/tyrosine transport system substrate-binding protein